VARGQVTQGAAEIYDCYFVPALFAQWTHIVGNAACVDRGSRTLDVACGTGALARALVTRIGGTDHITGVDPNEGMLEVARHRAPTIAWRQAFAEQPPFEADTFDAVVCQFGLMFFADKVAGLREMRGRTDRSCTGFPRTSSLRRRTDSPFFAAHPATSSWRFPRARTRNASPLWVFRKWQWACRASRWRP
jgi:SAM-dependent methyltransferase